MAKKTKKRQLNVRQRLLKDIVSEALATIRQGEEGKGMTNAEYIFGQILTQKAAGGDLKAIDTLIKMSGEEEPQKVEQVIAADVTMSHEKAYQLILEATNDNL